MATTEKRKQSFKKWYEAHKAQYNAERQEKYSSDPQKRKEAQDRQKEYRKRVGPQARKHTRIMNGVAQEVFRTGAASEYVGRDSQTIRQWEKDGIIPPPSVVEAKHRYYTANQLQLMRELAELITQLRYHREALQLGITKKSSEIHLLWEN